MTEAQKKKIIDTYNNHISKMKGDKNNALISSSDLLRNGEKHQSKIYPLITLDLCDMEEEEDEDWDEKEDE